jgi:formylglycine-generating enzyme required for sulfatase activity
VRCAPFGSVASAPTDASTSTEGTGDGAATLEGGADPGDCPSGRGPTSIRVGGEASFCIDSTEVTRAQYRAFLDAKGRDTSGQPAGCEWNTLYTPGNPWPPTPTEESLPVVVVDWCDAYAFCAWAGKRLCGAIKGGPVARSAAVDPTQSQWTYACTKGGQHAYPYGDTYDDSRCNTASKETVAVGSRAACVGGFPGIFDMSGNVEEWEDSCDPVDAGATDLCRIRGGSFNDGLPAENYTCTVSTASYSQPRDVQAADLGFRCCSR